MATVFVRGRMIKCNAKPNQMVHYIRLYEGMTDEQLDRLDVESREERRSNLLGEQSLGDTDPLRTNKEVEEYITELNTGWQYGT